MNKLKLFLFIFSTIAMMVGIYSCVKDTNPSEKVLHDSIIENRSATVSGSCLEVLASECTGELQIDTLNFDVEIYPGCVANISWIEYLCLEPSTGIVLNVSFVNVFGWPIPGQCDSTLNSWNNLFNTGQYAQYNADILAYQFEVEKAFTKKRMQELLSLGLWPCSGNGAFLESKLFKASCQFVYNIQCGVSSGQGTISLPYIGSCGESCCKSTIWWCTDKDGTPVPSNPLVEQIGSCEGSREYPVRPKKGCTIFQEGICTDTCNK